jgi:hypothetical protein
VTRRTIVQDAPDEIPILCECTHINYTTRDPINLEVSFFFTFCNYVSFSHKVEPIKDSKYVLKDF